MLLLLKYFSRSVISFSAFILNRASTCYGFFCTYHIGAQPILRRDCADVDAQARQRLRCSHALGLSRVYSDRLLNSDSDLVLFHISNIGIKNKLTKQTVKILMSRLIFANVCPNLPEVRFYPTLAYLRNQRKDRSH